MNELRIDQSGKRMKKELHPLGERYLHLFSLIEIKPTYYGFLDYGWLIWLINLFYYKSFS